jgi:hypothetical protein
VRSGVRQRWRIPEVGRFRTEVQRRTPMIQLAQMDGGHWHLEAFLRLTEAAPHNRVAWLLSDRLAAGLSLEEPGR